MVTESARRLGRFALTLVLISAGAWWLYSMDPVRKGDRALAKLYGGSEDGTIAGRVWAAKSPPGTESLESRESVALASDVLAMVDHLGSKGEQRRALLASARLDSLAGRQTAAVEKLSSLLETGESAQRRDLEVINDLGVVLLTRAEVEGDPIDLLLAARWLSQAVALDPDRPEPIFNLSVALGRLQLHGQASRVWQQLSLTERSSAWGTRAAEYAAGYVADDKGLPARRSMVAWKQLKDELDRPGELETRRLEQASQAHAYELNQLGNRQLSRAAAAWRSADMESFLGWLIAAEQIGSTLAKDRSDFELVDRADWWRLRFEQGGQSELDQAAVLLQRFEQATKARTEDRYAEAEAEFTRLAPAFEELGSLLALECRLQAEIARYYHSSDDASEALERLLDEVPERYPALRGRVLWMMGILASSQNRYSDSENHLVRSQTLILEALGAARAAYVQMLRADNIDRRGETRRSWRMRLESLRVLTAQTDPHRRYGGLYEAAQALRRRQEPALARLFLQEASWTGHASPHVPVELSIEQARCALQLEDGGAAANWLRRAGQALVDLEGSGFKDRLAARLSMIRGMAEIDNDPATALSIFEQVQQTFADSGYRLTELPILLATAQVQESLGAADEAVASLESAVRNFEDARLDASAEVEAIGAFRRSDAVFDQLIERALARNSAGAGTPAGNQGIAGAFDWAERGRASVVFDRWRRQAEGTFLSAEQVAARLPLGTNLLSFTWLPSRDKAPGRLVCWVFVPGDFRFVDYGELPVSKIEIAAFQDLLEGGASTSTVLDEAERLYQRLIEPLELDIAEIERLVVVPDGATGQIPFSLLASPDTGQMLLEQLRVSYAPSVSLAIHAIERLRAFDPSSRDHRAKIVIASANQSVSRSGEAFPSLSFSGSDALEIAKLFETHQIIAQATPRQVLEALPTADVFHYSGHAQSSASRWGENALLLAADPGQSSGYLGLTEILSNSQELRLVTLAGCETLRGYESSRGAAFSLAMAFFASGVPSVVGTRWAVDDRRSIHLLKDFYREYAQSGDVAESLRRAKLRFHKREATSSRPNWSWAAFELIGV